ncbi:MAG: hypothetical protein ABIP68_01675 [Ferruginibacter sp.]
MSKLKARAISHCLQSIISINSFDRDSLEEKEALKEALKNISTYPKIENLKRISLKNATVPDQRAVKVLDLLRNCLSGSLTEKERVNLLPEIDSALFEALEYL